MLNTTKYSFGLLCALAARTLKPLVLARVTITVWEHATRNEASREQLQTVQALQSHAL